MSTPSNGDRARTAESVLALIRKMNLAERTRLFGALYHQQGLWNETAYGVIPREIMGHFTKALDNMLAMNDAHQKSLAKLRDDLRRRTPKPRKTDRDDEIVRLYDEQGKTFGEIPRLLVQTNGAWLGKDGKPMTRDAVEKAYHRRKRKPTK